MMSERAGSIVGSSLHRVSAVSAAAWIGSDPGLGLPHGSGPRLGAAIPRPLTVRSRRKAASRTARRALASAPQDEDDVCMPSPVDLILRSGHRPRLEGRITPMQGLQYVCMPERESGGDEGTRST